LYTEEISAWVLLNVKQNAEIYLKHESNDVIITVPARFNDSQRQSTKDAAEIVGFKVKAIINEPTAAALAYKFENTINGSKKILLFDLGGGTFDVSIVQINGNEFKVITTGGDTHLGGEDFDNELMNFCINSFKEETQLEITDPKAKRRLKIACEEAKIRLSSQIETEIDLDNICGDENLFLNIQRSDFEFCIAEYITKCEQILKSTLNEANLDINEIDDVVLVGGSTRIPKIQEMVKNFFNKEVKKSVNPDEAVALGAAIYSHNFDNQDGNEDIRVIDICPYSLGIGSKGKEMSVMIPKNTPLPHTFTDQFYTIKDAQTYFGIGVYQGEDKSIENNYKLGSFFVRGIEKKKKEKLVLI
jgi:molecular chaperone DnaK (HSP70)